MPGDGQQNVANLATKADIPSAIPTPPLEAPGRFRSLLNDVLGDNPYFNAGFGLMGMGVVLTVLRRSLVLGSTALRRRMLVNLEVSNRDRAFGWVLAWMANQAQLQAHANASEGGGILRNITSGSLTRGLVRSHQLSVETRFQQHRNGSSSVMFDLVAGPGVHWFKYRNAWMQVKRERDTKAMHLTSGTPWETVTLTTLSRDRALFTSLLTDARDLAMREQEGKLVVYTAWGTEWRPFGLPRRKRPLDSVVLAEGVKERIERDTRAFLERRRWYADRGIPYRRGYLLHGPPGSGKSSFIQALAGSLSYDICLLNLSERGLGDDKLNHLLSNAIDRSIILIEDVDAAFNKRVQTSEDGYQSSVTFSGFLNALDGVVSGEERIIFMTTNHIERLDPALIRPGRVDVSELIDDAEPHQAKHLFVHFYQGDSEGGGWEGEGEGVSKEEVERLGNMLEEIVRGEMQEGRRVSMAALQGLFIRHGAEDAIQECRALFMRK